MRRNAPVGDPDFGRAFPCVCQEQVSEGVRQARLRRYSNLGLLMDVRLEGLNPLGPSASAEGQARYGVALEAARGFTERPQGLLLLTGGNGVGKTRLAAAAANRLIELGRPVFFAFVPDLLDQLRGSYAPDSELDYGELFELVKNAPVLALDDLGGHSGTAWAEEKLFQIINHRYIASLPTIVTSSVQVDRLEGRLQTRLMDSRWSRVVDLGGSAKAGMPEMGAIPAAMRKSMTFESFDPWGLSGDKRAMQLRSHVKSAVWSFAQTLERWLVLYGGTGSGKTHLAVAVANTQLEKGRDVFYAFVPDLLDHLRDTYNPDSRVTYDELFDRVKQAHLLILDDLGGENSSSWAYEKLYQIIVRRQHAELPTIVTFRSLHENKSDPMADPIASRLNDGRLVTPLHLDVQDYRNTGKQQSQSSYHGSTGRRRSPEPRRPF